MLFRIPDVFHDNSGLSNNNHLPRLILKMIYIELWLYHKSTDGKDFPNKMILDILYFISNFPTKVKLWSERAWIIASCRIFPCCRGPWADGRLLLVWKHLNKNLGLSHVPWPSFLQYLLGSLWWSSSISCHGQTKLLGTVLMLWLLGGMGCSVNES